ncbi:unnamed protein product [Blepharisma stoltei]|uniref:Phosphoglycerate mutase n=1 Tax=Blepharisma stoltei TaxID=1481888 RepID=A0AAU9JYH1_9CILI|nr:unnamed protein product [Blepharisma stoltei]
MLLYLARHGETLANISKRMQGHTGGELSPLGIEQVTKLSTRLSEHKFDAIYSSDLNRCIQTLSYIIKHHGTVEPIYDSRLREICSGDYEDQPFADYAHLLNPFGFPATRDSPFPGGESLLDVNRRVKNFFDFLINRHMNVQMSSNEEQKILVVTHCGFIMEFLNFLLEMKGESPREDWRIQNTAVFVFRITINDEKVNAEIVTFNDASHLSN